jgi:hypothetical protein
MCYPTDLYDGEWDCPKLHVPAPNRRGRPRTHSTREIAGTSFCVLQENGVGLALGWHHALPRGRKGLPLSASEALKEGDIFSVGRYYSQKFG